MGHFCVVVGCSSQAGRRKNDGKVGFFRFPKDRREQWVAAIRRINPDGSKWDPNEHSRICSRHFLTRKPSRDVSHPDFKPTIFPTSHVKPSTVSDKSRHDRVLARRARIEEECKMNKVQESLAQKYIQIINSLIAKMRELETKKDCLLEKKRSLVIRKFKLEETIRQNVEGRDREECNMKTGRKDVACQTDSGLHAFILGDSLEFSSSQEGNDVRCQILSPGYFSQGSLTVMEVIADDEYVRSKPAIHGQFDSKFCADDLKGDKTFKSVCGVSEKIFTIVLLSISPQLKASPNFSVKRKLVLFLIKLKHNLSYIFLGKIFNISDRHASQLFSQVLEIMFIVSDKFVYWIPQSAIKTILPKSFRLGFPNCTGIIDAIEVKIEAPSDIRGSVLTYSSYKAAHTLKFLICIAPSGVITFISKCYGGRVTDCHLTVDSGFLELLRPGDLILADKGFPQIVEEAERRGAFCVMPPFCRGDFQLTEKQNREGYQCSPLRIHVERAIQRMKMFRILQFCEQTLLPDIDKIVVSISFLCNLMNNLIKD